MKKYEDNQMLHNQFRLQVTSRIDETVFRPLFCENFVAPNNVLFQGFDKTFIDRFAGHEIGLSDNAIDPVIG